MQLYIGNLSDDMTEGDVKECISGIYLPQSMTIIRDMNRVNPRVSLF
jgi:hypothetical protein